MISNEFAEASAEIDEILEYLPSEFIDKVPKKLREFFKRTKKEGYTSKINPYRPLDEQELLPKTEILLTVLYRNYWCSVEERKELDKALIENENKYEEEIREKYNPDNIFKRMDKENEITEVEETSLIVYDNNIWYKKAFLFISNILKKIFNK